ncbi:hypothetical protein MY4824_009602 [Beauveria thailandica]
MALQDCHPPPPRSSFPRDPMPWQIQIHGLKAIQKHGLKAIQKHGLKAIQNHGLEVI